MTNFELKTKIYFGTGEADNLNKYLSEHNFRRCGVVIDKALLENEKFVRLLKNLEKGMQYYRHLVYEHRGEPSYEYLDTVKAYFKQGEIDCILGIGGGSVIDTAKGLAALINNPVRLSRELKGFPKLVNQTIPVVAIPTISGTGSEVTYNAVFTDEAEKRKLGINTKYNFPVFSLLDAQLTLDAPLKQSISSALDCMVHALESFMSKKSTFITRPFSAEAFYYFYGGFVRLLEDASDIKAREDLMKASYLAGIALMNSSAGPSGALSYPLGVAGKVPHGLAGAFYMQHVLKYNILSGGYTGLSLLYDKINGAGKGLSDKDKSEELLNTISGLLKKGGVPAKLSDFGIKESDLDYFMHQAENYLWGAFEVNPVPFTKESLKDFLTSLL